jgi:hypothetical protein
MPLSGPGARTVYHLIASIDATLRRRPDWMCSMSMTDFSSLDWSNVSSGRITKDLRTGKSTTGDSQKYQGEPLRPSAGIDKSVNRPMNPGRLVNFQRTSRNSSQKLPQATLLIFYEVSFQKKCKFRALLFSPHGYRRFRRDESFS